MKNMHTVGKKIIMIPAMVLVFTILLRFAGFLPQESSEDRARVLPQQEVTMISPTAPQVQPFGGLTQGQKIDLQGPLRCDYSQDETEVTVRIHKRSILVKYSQGEMPQQYMVVNGDTLYIWDQGTYEGQRIDGIGQYLSLIDSFSAFLTPDMLLAAIPQAAQIDISDEQIDALKQSCESGPVDDTVFTIPDSVQFTAVEINELQSFPLPGTE